MRRHSLLHLIRNQAGSLAQAGETTEYTEELVKQDWGQECLRSCNQALSLEEAACDRPGCQPGGLGSIRKNQALKGRHM